MPHGPFKEAAALWYAGLIHADGAGNFRWSRRIAHRHPDDPLPRLARGAVASRVIPQNKALRRAIHGGRHAVSSVGWKRGGMEKIMAIDLHEVGRATWARR